MQHAAKSSLRSYFNRNLPCHQSKSGKLFVVWDCLAITVIPRQFANASWLFLLIDTNQCFTLPFLLGEFHDSKETEMSNRGKKPKKVFKEGKAFIESQFIIG